MSCDVLKVEREMSVLMNVVSPKIGSRFASNCLALTCQDTGPYIWILSYTQETMIPRSTTLCDAVLIWRP